MQATMLTDDEFRLFSTLIYDESGIAIKEGKREYLQARLLKRLHVNRLNSYYRYYKFVSDKNEGRQELLDLVSSLTINETSFFRNKPQFDLFAGLVIPELKKRRQSERRLRFWSAGCSKGQEAYSIAISLLEHLDFPDTWDLKILASDISTTVLESAEKGIYSKSEIEILDPGYQHNYFDKIEGRYHIKQRVRKLVEFDFHNLKHDNGPALIDVIFCRNVMIYFDYREQKRLVEKFYENLNEQGYLFLGHAESLQGLTDRFKFMYRNKGAVYQKIG